VNDNRIEISGSPTPEEERAILQALENMLRRDREARSPSAWQLVGRAIATRSGILDYHDRLGRPAWNFTERLQWMGQPYSGRHGRGDAK
jgi:hypothetical protein